MKWLCLVASLALGIVGVTYADTPAEPTIIATGCIEPASAEPAAIRPDTKFVLVDPAVAAKTAAGRPVSSTVAYRIDDANDSKVAPHQGQKVQLKGQLEPQAPVAQGSRVPAPKINVASVEVLASSCTK